MTFLKLLPVIFSFLILAAHFYRAGIILFSILSVLALFIPIIKASWTPRLMQVLLYLGTAEWLRTLFARVSERQAIGQPWLRMAIILGAVALLTLLSSFVFQGKSIREYYHLENS